jgi:hypothetical protein
LVAGVTFAETGDITIGIQDLGGNPIAPGSNVRGEVWGYSQSLGEWVYLPKDAVSDGSGGSTITWSASDIQEAVNVNNHDFHFVVTAWGGVPTANGQIESPSGLWGQFIPYNADTEVTWDVRTYTDPVYPATQTPTGLKYDVDLGGLAPVYSWPEIYVSYEGCAADSQPVIPSFKKASLELEGYTFDESLLAAQGLLRIQNVSRGYDEVVSARSDGEGGYILELEYIGDGSLTYDGTAKELLVDIEYAALGLGPGDRFFSQPSFGIDGPGSYTSGDESYDTIDWLVPGAVSSVLDVQRAPVPEPMTMLAFGSAVAGLGGYIRRRRRA